MAMVGGGLCQVVRPIDGGPYGGDSSQAASKGKSGGKGKDSSTAVEEQVEEEELPTPPITVQTLQVGDVVDVFHRYAQDPNGYFMVQNPAGGIMHPSCGWTDGWTEAKITEAWDVANYKVENYRTWVEIQWLHPTWYNRRGHKLDTSQASMVTQRVRPEQIRQRGEPSEAQDPPKLSLLHIRWGGEQPVNPVTEGAGGWGQIGSTPSDNYINGFENQVFEALGPTYEVISVFFQNSEELNKVCPALLQQMARGQHIAALYFMWPIVFQDGHQFPAYVERDRLFRLMVEMESTGIPTRFPHQSNLYRVFASKEWTAQMCLHPLLRVPLTTMVSRQAIACDPGKAAAQAMKALQNLAQVRCNFGEQTNQGRGGRPIPVQRGVAKLGWSWEAMDVQAWRNKQELQNSLSQLADQPGSLVDFVFVQEWVDFEVEIRHFIVEPDFEKPESLKPKKRIYTVFKSKEGGAFRNFDRYDRQGCLKACFQHDDAALADAEAQCQELILRWLQWLQAQSHELPVVTRFDILVKRSSPGKATITTGELTELGGCFLGWPEGPKTVFAAMLRSCFRDSGVVLARRPS